MASAKDTATFFTHGTHLQYEHVLKLYPQALKLKAEQKAKKPEELVKLDNWYQNELPKKIKSRGKDAHMLHEELVQTMKWKQTRGKYYPQLSYLVKVNTPRAVMAETRKAFRKLPNLEQAITALSNLKGVGTTMASALLAAACPESAPFMADECLLAIPDIEGIDYTTKEYLKFVNHIQQVAERLNKSAKESNRNDSIVWSPHKVELALWTHYVVSDIKPELLSSVFAENGNSIISPPSVVVHQNGDSLDTSSTSEESNQESGLSNGKSSNNNNNNSNSKNNNNNKTSGTTTTTAVIDEDTNTSFADNNSTSPQSIIVEDETTNDDSIISDSTNDSTITTTTITTKRPLNHQGSRNGGNNDDDDSNSLEETPCKKLKDEIGDK